MEQHNLDGPNAESFELFSAFASKIIVKKLNSLKQLVRTTVAESHN